MGVLGGMFPDRKLRSEAGEAGSGQGWRFDLDAGVVELYPVTAEPGDHSDDAAGAEDAAPPTGAE